MKEQFKEYVIEVFSSNMDALQMLLNTSISQLREKKGCFRSWDDSYEERKRSHSDDFEHKN